MTTLTQTTCCYCGVGCGMLVESDGERIVGVRGDPSHPANHGRLCSKGMTLPLTASSLAGRVLTPELRATRDAARAPTSWDDALATVASRFADVIRRHGPHAVAFYVSGQLLTEIVFTYPGLGYALMRAVSAVDYPLMQALFLIITLSVLAANFLDDGDRARTCLLVDLWHPDTTGPERTALTVLMTEIQKMMAGAK